MRSFRPLCLAFSFPFGCARAELAPQESWRYQISLLWLHISFGALIAGYLLQSTIRTFLRTRNFSRRPAKSAPIPVSPSLITVAFPAGVILAEKAAFDFPDNRKEMQKAIRPPRPTLVIGRSSSTEEAAAAVRG
jgi:hypothetical protein